MTIAEQIYTLVKTLPQDQASEILLFAEFISTRRSQANPGVDAAPAPVPWAEFVHSLAGAWADDFPELDDIRSGIGPDVFRESL